MADNSIANDLLSSLGGAITAQANRPQKTSSTTTSTPLQLADMLARRNTIGNASANLAESLKQREGLGYNLAAALSNVPQQQGYGNWLSGGAKSFGDAFNSRANMAMDNAQKQYDASRTDLSDALNYDKEMGNQQTEDIGYNDGGSGGGNLATQTYTDLDPTLPDRLEKSEGFGYLGREALSSATNPESTGVFGRLYGSLARGATGDETLAEQSGLLQEVSKIGQTAIAEARIQGSTGGMMNSDREGSRALAVFANPSAYSGKELSSAVKTFYKFRNRWLASKGLPSIEQGYNAISTLANQPKINEENTSKTGGLTY